MLQEGFVAFLELAVSVDEIRKSRTPVILRYPENPIDVGRFGLKAASWSCAMRFAQKDACVKQTLHVPSGLKAWEPQNRAQRVDVGFLVHSENPDTTRLQDTLQCLDALGVSVTWGRVLQLGPYFGLSSLSDSSEETPLGNLKLLRIN